MSRQVPMRLGEDHERMIDEVAAIRGGLKRVQVVRLALEELHRKVVGGRRGADLVPVKRRRARAGEGP